MSQTARTRDTTNFVSSGNDALSYTSLQNYQAAGTNNVPQSSLLLMTVAPSSIKYFDPTPTFQTRLDNYRIPPSTQVPVNLTWDYNDPAQSTPAPESALVSTAHSPYANVAHQAYKIGRR